jgi:pyruvate formate lyase activating enzyme
MGNDLCVGGIVPLTTIDYPGYLSAVIFLQGCNWRCKYCHNPHLQGMTASESFPWEDVLNLLRMRRGFVEAVVFSGGEPLLQAGLSGAVADVASLGFRLGLHTSGAFPERFEEIISSLHWVGFDLKYAFNSYQFITGVEDSGEAALASLKILLKSQVDFEVRMTLHESMEIPVIVKVLEEVSLLGVKNVALQKCRDRNENVVEHPIFSDKLLLESISRHFDSFHIRD